MWGSLRACKRLLSSTPARLLAPATLAVAVTAESYRRRPLCEEAYKEEAEEERKKAEELKNPGGFEKLLEDGKRLVTPDIFEGFRLEIQKMVTPHFYIGHTFTLGQQIPNTNINASYDFSTHTILQPGNQLLMARVSQMGSVDGRYHFGLGDRLLFKLVGSLQPNPAKDVYQFEAEYAGDTAHFTLRGSKGPTVYASYMQSVTPNVAVGGDSLFDLTEGAGIFSFGGRYTGPDYAIVGMLGQLCVLQYIRRVNPNRMSLVADLMVNPMTLDGQAVLGAEVTMKQSRFLTTVDNDGRLAASMEAKVVPNAVNMLLSAEIMHTKNEYKFGYGFQINL